MILSNEVEFDEAYVVAGHKGQPEVVKSKRRKGRRRRRKSKSGRGTMEKEKPPVFGMIERGGQVVIHLLDNVKQKTIEPLIKDTIESGTLVYTDEHRIYARLERWGYAHKSVNHGRGEYARDEDGDGFCEVHVNTMEGFWSLLRSWLRPHRGISQEKLPLYLGFFEFVHNMRKRGKALLGALIELLVCQDPGIQKERQRKVRKTLAFSKSHLYPGWMSGLSVVPYTFCRAHGSLRMKDANGMHHRTPAMASGLTDRIGSTRDGLLSPILGGAGSSQDTTMKQPTLIKCKSLIINGLYS